MSRSIFQTDWTNIPVHFQKLLSNSFKCGREKLALHLARTLNMIAETFLSIIWLNTEQEC